VNPKEKFELANAILLDKTLSAATRIVGWYIADHVNTRRGFAWPPQELIARDLGLGLRTVGRAVKELRRYFHMHRQRRNRATEYRPSPAKMAAEFGARLAKMASPTGPNGRSGPAKMAAHPLNDPPSDPLRQRPPRRKQQPVDDPDQYVTQCEAHAATDDTGTLKLERPVLEQLVDCAGLSEGLKVRVEKLLAVIHARPQ
jgi:hypothetical protein